MDKPLQSELFEVKTLEEGERWGEHGSYSVSDLGRLKRPSGDITLGWERNGYKAITIDKNKYYVHRLVAGIFCEGFCKDAVVDHIDGNKVNNNYLNLRWVSLSVNSLNCKDRSPRKFISEEEVFEMLRLKEELGLTNTKIGVILGIDRTNVSRILNGRSRSLLTGL